MTKHILSTLWVFIIFLPLKLSAQEPLYKNKVAALEDRVNSLLSQMTLDEKLDYIGGYKYLCIRPIERLGLPKIYMSDGPVGVNEYGQSTAYPCGIMDAATWDTELIEKLGKALGKDARARGVHVLLAPGVNIYRAPMCGRNFEYFGEDPYLASRMAVSYINGVQSQKVVTTIKHYVANNQEWDRHNISSDMDERTLQEIYLPAFKAAVTEAKVGAVMNSYNLLNGIYTTQHSHLNLDILKKDWKFDGILMSDWHATYDGVAAVKNGLDLEMPSGKFMKKDTLLPAIKNGIIAESDIDEKVRRILRIIFRFGFYDNPQTDNSIPKDNPENSQVALQVAREGIVLLKNENKVLPLNADKIKTIAVIGPNAESYISGGGSSGVNPFHSVSLLKGITNIASNKIKVNYVPAALSTTADLSRISVFYTKPGSKEQGLTSEYFHDSLFTGKPDSTHITKTLNLFTDDFRNIHGLPPTPFSIRWTGVIRPTKKDTYNLTLEGYNDGYDKYSVWIDDKMLINLASKAENAKQTVSLPLEAGKEYSVKLEYYCHKDPAAISFAWYPERPDFSPAIEAAKHADAVVLAMGFNEDLEQENLDRTFELPQYQDSLINAIVKVNRKTIVVLNAGGNVAMQQWLPKVPALLHAWYAGQEGGTAIAQVLFGKINPSGKLPASFEKQWKDNPVYHSYYDDSHTKHVNYKEGLFVGYRYWDTTKIQPAFPFGFGLSYTQFAYSDLKLTKEGANGVTASFDIKNIGNEDGAEVAELYVHQQKCPVVRPVKELKGFTKVFLKKGETKRVSIKLDSNAFAYYHEQMQRFANDAGAFDIIVGASSKDLRLRQTVTIQ